MNEAKEIMELRAMPKVELHIHIEGAVSPETYYALAEKNNTKLPCNNLKEWKDFFKFENFAHFIDVYMLAVSTIKEPEDFSFIIENFYKYQKSQNIIYSEAYLSASLIVGKFDNTEILDAIEKGMKEGERKYNVKVNIKPDIARNIPETKDKVLDLVIQGHSRGLFIGLGLGGLEEGFPASMFEETYNKATSTGMKVVAHAGEGVGPESIWQSIRLLKAQRIGHGIRSVDDPELLEYLKKTQLPIEVSPTSNYRLGLVADTDKHPIRKMVDSGVLCTLNSDDPAMFSTSLSDEYELLYKQGFSKKELYQLNINAINSAFISDEEKDELQDKIDLLKYF